MAVVDLWHRVQSSVGVTFDEWPVPDGSEWVEYVNGAETQAELLALRRTVLRGAPFGDVTLPRTWH